MTEQAWIRLIDGSQLNRVADLAGRWKRFLDPSPASGGMVFGMGQLAPGEAAGWHEHPEPELFYVLEGTALGEWRDDDVIHQQRLVPGKAFFKAGWVPHRMTNDGPELFRGLFFKLESR